MRESGENPILVDTRMSMFAREGRLEDSITVTMQDVIREGEFGAHLAPDPVKAAAAFASLGIDSSHPVVLAGDYTDPASKKCCESRGPSSMLRTLLMCAHNYICRIRDWIALASKKFCNRCIFCSL